MTNHERARELEREIIAQQEALLQKTKVLGEELKAEVKDTISRVVETVGTGVSTVSESLDSNIRGVADRVHHSMDRVRTTFDVPARVDAAPFKMLGFAAVAGGVLGLLAGRGARNAPATSHHMAPRGLGPAALVGLGFSFLKPILANAAQDFIARRFGGDTGTDAEAPTGNVAARGRGGYNRGQFIHEY